MLRGVKLIAGLIYSELDRLKDNEPLTALAETGAEPAAQPCYTSGQISSRVSY